MPLDSYMYRNPCDVLMRKQEFEMRKFRACGDCIHARHFDFNGEALHACEFKRKSYGKRCELFSLTKEKHDR